jgi:hypothetical protein
MYLYEDEKGHKFLTRSEIACYYKISDNSLNRYIKMGLSVAEAIKKCMESETHTECHDHKGNMFNNVAQMCDKYHVGTACFYTRIALGWSLKEALTTAVNEHAGKECYDHVGNVFPSKSSMCRFYEIPLNTFYSRLKNGWSLEKALTTQSSHSRHICDHLGNRYSTTIAMCKKYNITIDCLNNRLKLGWSLEKTLTTPINHSKVGTVISDHLGNKYRSMCALAKAYNINRSVLSIRLNEGWDMERALTTPVQQNSDESVDHLGNKYESFAKMAKAYNLNPTTLDSRLRNNWTLEKALTTPLKNTSAIAYDHLGNSYESFTDMARHYNMDPTTLTYRLKVGKSMQDALTTPVRKRGG